MLVCSPVSSLEANAPQISGAYPRVGVLASLFGKSSTTYWPVSTQHLQLLLQHVLYFKIMPDPPHSRNPRIHSKNHPYRSSIILAPVVNDRVLPRSHQPFLAESLALASQESESWSLLGGSRKLGRGSSKLWGGKPHLNTWSQRWARPSYGYKRQHVGMLATARLPRVVSSSLSLAAPFLHMMKTIENHHQEYHRKPPQFHTHFISKGLIE